MKRIRIMLTAIAVFAVVGTALAFKAQMFSQVVLCSTAPSPIVDCTVIFEQATFTADPEGALYCTTNGQECDVKAIVREN